MGIFDRDYIQDPRTAQVVGTFSSRVYGWMAIGLGFTAFVAYFVFTGCGHLLALAWPWVLMHRFRDFL